MWYHSPDMQLYERFDEIARWILIALIGLLPIFALPISWITVPGSKMLLASLLLFTAGSLWACARFMEGRMQIPRNLVVFAALSLPVAYTLSTFIAGTGSVSIVGTGVEIDTLAFMFLAFSGFFLAASLFSRSAASLSRALFALFGGGIVLFFVEFIHLLIPALSFGGVFAGQTGNLLGSWHEVAMFAGLLFFLSVYLQATKPRRALRIAQYASGAILFAFLVITGFNDVWAAIFTLILVMLGMQAYREGFEEGIVVFLKSRWAQVVLAIVALFFALFIGRMQTALPQSLNIAHLEVRPSWGSTLSIAKESLTAEPSALLFGSGPNTFTRQWGLHKPSAVNQTLFWSVDFPVGIAPIPTAITTVGIVGALSWLAFLASILWLSYGMIRSRVPKLSNVLFALIVSVLYLFGLHIASTPGISITLLMFLLCGLLVSYALRPKHLALPVAFSSWSPKVAGGGILVVVFAFALLFASVGELRVVIAEALVNRSITTYNQTGDMNRASSYVAQALLVYPSDDRAHRAAVELGLLELRQLAASAGADEAATAQLQETLHETIDHGLNAVSIDGDDYQNWLELASIYAELVGSNVQGAYENARDAYMKAAEDNPTSPLPLESLARLEMLQGNADAALKYLDQALALKPDYAAALYLRSQTLVALSRPDEAQESAALAAQFAPSDPQAWYNLGLIQYVAGNDAGAVLGFKQALSLDPNFANAIYLLGLTYYRMDDTANALSALTSLDKLDPGHDIVQKLMSDIRSGKSFTETSREQGSIPLQ